MRWQLICRLAGVITQSTANPEQSLSDPEICGVSEDSRKVRSGYIFVAQSGSKEDGHRFADTSVEQGAVAIIGNRTGINNWHGVPYGYAENPRRAAALIAQALVGNPTESMCVIGVTGTNGKSSVAAMTQSVLRAAGNKCGNFGTLGYDIGDEIVDAPLTTPDAECLANLFAQARDNGCTHVVMEVSSHALDQERVAGIHFYVAALTNVTQDHLDYHKNMSDYRAAKLKLFSIVEKFSVVNADDASASFFEKASAVKVLQYSINTENADLRGTDIHLGFDATQFHLATPWGAGIVRLQLLGKHTVYNALCTAAVCGALGVDYQTIVRGLENLPKVNGRFEPVYAGQDFHVVVDYAHTEDALLNTLQSARQLCQGKIIAVFGCGGDRDKGKRPKMGAIAAQHADTLVLTSDNPRSEDPLQILREVEGGVVLSGLLKDKDYWVIENRRDAIAHAIGMAQTGDLVLIAGKGHENYQIIGNERFHFDDRECAREILEGL